MVKMTLAVKEGTVENKDRSSCGTPRKRQKSELAFTSNATVLLPSDLFRSTGTERAVYPEHILFLCLLFDSLFDITPTFSLGSFAHFKGF